MAPTFLTLRQRKTSRNLSWGGSFHDYPVKCKSGASPYLLHKASLPSSSQPLVMELNSPRIKGREDFFFRGGRCRVTWNKTLGCESLFSPRSLFPPTLVAASSIYRGPESYCLVLRSSLILGGKKKGEVFHFTPQVLGVIKGVRAIKRESRASSAGSLVNTPPRRGERCTSIVLGRIGGLLTLMEFGVHDERKGGLWEEAME